MDPVYGYQSVNVEAQQRYGTSLLNWVRRMIHLRKEHPVFGRGSIEFIKPENRKVFAFTHVDERETILCVFNLSQSAQPAELDLSRFQGAIPVEMLGEAAFPAIQKRPSQLALAPRDCYCFLLKDARAAAN